MLREAGHLQYVITIGLVPLSLLLFGQISLVSPLANAIAIPLVSFMVTPLALLGSVLPMPLAGWVLGSAHAVVAVLAAGLEWLSALPSAVWRAPLPPWWLFAAALLGILWLLAPRGWPHRRLGWIAVLALLFNRPSHPTVGEMWLTAFDVGQGMALLIETAHHRMLYDTGPQYAPESDGANRVLLPYFNARGIAALDGLIISHRDSDHAGGALSLLQAMPVDWLLASLAPQDAIMRAAVQAGQCRAGQGWEWDGVSFAMLHPQAESYAQNDLKPNARSCTLKITAGRHSVLLAGDLEAAQEQELLARAPDQLAATVLLAPHHGSGTSSTLPFLMAVRPAFAVFQVGYRNRYHHPKAEIFERYGSLGITRLRTDTAGAVRFDFAGRLGVHVYRRECARYWFSGATTAEEFPDGNFVMP
jgi:competence protein ComEC